MTVKVVLLTPARRFIANRYGVGYQLPLGLVLLGGPLLDAGHDVWLIDNDAYGWNSARLVEEVRSFRPDIILLGHTGSTAAHQTCIQTATQLRAAFPTVPIGYGGVYPSYAAQEVLQECPAVDVIVRGEGEATTLELIDTWQKGNSLAKVKGIAWRDNGKVRLNPVRPPIQNLDTYRPGWELVDWEQYNLFGHQRAAGLQFSRGCPLTCTFCGQWMFWKKWRHRSPQNLVQELRTLKEQYGVSIVWLADENFSADRATTETILTHIAEANLGLSLNINMTAADVVRDADLLPLYKAAGVDYVVMGVESLEDNVVTAIRKNNPFQLSKEAVRLLRQHHIISFVNIINGLQEETWRTMWRKFWKIRDLNPDILNAEYITPHFWTKDGRNTNPQDIVQLDMSKWTYRNQVIDTPHMSPAGLFLAVKLTEALIHLRPAHLKRLLWGGDKRTRQILRHSLLNGTGVVLAEIAEFLFQTHFSPRGSLHKIPGATPKRTSSVPLPTI